MLYVILYESAELIYSIAKLGYNGISTIYRWYNKTNSLEREKEIEIQKIKNIDNRLKELEYVLINYIKEKDKIKIR